MKKNYIDFVYRAAKDFGMTIIKNEVYGLPSAYISLNPSDPILQTSLFRHIIRQDLFLMIHENSFGVTVALKNRYGKDINKTYSTYNQLAEGISTALKIMKEARIEKRIKEMEKDFDSEIDYDL